MLVEVKVPPLAESVPDATLLAWRVKPGDAVRRGDNLIDLETDKVTLEVAATADGVVNELRRNAGDRVVANDVLAILDTSAKSNTAAVKVEPSVAPAIDAPAAAAPSGPAARKMLAENNVDPASVKGSGKDGRITKGDLLNYARPAPVAVSDLAPSPEAASTSTKIETSASERRVPMTRLRRTAAERLLAAQHQHAILTTFNEINMQSLLALRDRYRESFEGRHQTRLGLMSFFAKACVAAVQRFPVVNAAVDGDDIVYHDYCDLGIAVASDRGLVVPVLRGAENKSFAAIEREIRDFGVRAGQGKLTLQELSGGTFTITNGGVFGSLLSTPILNSPQSAILGMHKIEERPVVEAGQIVIRPMMYAALSYDHRIIDGREAVQFLVAVKDALEDPVRLLLDL